MARTDDFLRDLEKIVEENKRLKQGGLPEEWAPIVNVVGTRVWESLAISAFVITGGVFLVWPLGVLGLVRYLLLME